MSDRIDELVAEAEFLNDNGCDKCEIVTQLATIAREAEANVKGQEANAVFALQLKREAEARAAEWIDRCYQSEARALKAEAMCEWMAEELVVSGWCRPDGERENAPCHAMSRRRRGETCCECALRAAEEAVRR